MPTKTNDLYLDIVKQLLTHDSDFGTLTINEGKPFYGIIYLRLRNVSVRNVTKVYEKLLRLDTQLPSQTIVVLEDTRVRIRHYIEGESD